MNKWINDLRMTPLIVYISVSIPIIPTVYYVSSLIHEGQIKTLEERVELQKEQILILKESKGLLLNKLTQSAASPQVSVDADSVPAARLPAVLNSNRLTREEIRQLASFYGLFTHWKVNPHLTYQDGDIAYWFEKGLTLENLRMEFDTRRKVLQDAERTLKKLSSQSELSHAAENLQQIIRR